MHTVSAVNQIKKTGSGTKKDISSFELLTKGSLEVGKGGLICMDETKAWLTDRDRIIPVYSRPA